MKRWGIVVTALYAALVLGLILLVMTWTTGESAASVLTSPFMWIWLAVVVTCQAVLLVLRVDTSARRPARRSHILVSVGAAAFALALLSGAAITSGMVAIFGDGPSGLLLFDSTGAGVLAVVSLWSFWSVMFYRHSRERPAVLDHLFAWLMKGSVLELLIVVPCHVIVRRRGDCSAPLVTGYGIATGIAVMLMAFGPSVVFLYRAQLQKYQRAHQARV